MKRMTASFGSLIAQLLVTIVLLVYGCGGESQQTGNPESNTGSIGFQVKWHPLETSQSQPRALPGTCSQLGVDTVDIFIYDQNNARLAGTDEAINCEIGQAAIDNVPEGQNRVLYFLGRDQDGQIIYRGIKAGINVVANETTPAGEIDAYPFSPATGTPNNPAPLGNSSVQFTWGAIDSADRYRIQISSDDQFTSTLVDETVTASSFSQTLPANGDYFWRVRSVDSVGHESAWFLGSCTININYTIYVSATTGGTVEWVDHGGVSGEISVAYGSNHSFTIQPEEGFRLAGLVMDEGNLPAPPVGTTCELNAVSANHTLTAQFEPIPYAITVDPAITNGTISISGQPPVTGDVTVNHGNSITFDIQPATGYNLMDLIVDGVSQGGVPSTGTTYTFDDVTADHTISAQFGIASFAILVDPDISGGNISILNQGAVSGNVIVEYGQSITFVIAPATGYTLADVLVDNQSEGNVTSYAFTSIAGNHTISALFEPIMNSVYVVPYSGGTVQVGGTTVSGNVPVAYGQSITFDIQPDAGNGYYLADILLDGTSMGAQQTGDSYTINNIMTGYTIEAVFNLYTYTINTVVEGNGTIDPAGPIQVNHNDSQVFSITPAPGNFLSELYIGNNSEPLSETYTFQQVTSGPQTIRAVFHPVKFVDQDSTYAGGDLEGLSWPTAYKTIQTAINNASPGDHIWVKADDYILTSNITINNVVAIYGGFTGTERFFSERNWEDNQTILDGDDTIRCLNITADATLDGFTIQNGMIEGFMNATYGGGINIVQVSPTIANCTFNNNRAIAMSYISTISGGAIYSNGGSPIILNCEFNDNYTISGQADATGGAIYNGSGGGLIQGCTFNRNRVEASEGAVGGAVMLRDSSMVVEQSVFIENQCRTYGYNAYGGAIYINGGSPTIESSTFLRNMVTGYAPFGAHGGAVRTYRADLVTLANCVFAQNVAYLLNPENGRSGMGGAIYNAGTEMSIDSCTIMENLVDSEDLTATFGGGLYNVGFSSIPSNITVTNTILWGNDANTGPQIETGNYATTSLDHCNIDQSGYAGSNGNISISPSVDAYFHLMYGSAGMNQGAAITAVDIDGEARPIENIPDIGADEYLDTVGEGIPDYWDLKFEFDPNSDNRQLDPDNDGLTNMEEYQFGTNPRIQDTIPNALNRGYWDSIGSHDQTNDQTLVNFTANSYLIFDVGHMAGKTVRMASLQLELASYQSSQLSEVLNIYDVSTAASELESSGTGRTDIYSDLETGEMYASVSVAATDVDTILTIPLNETAVADINSAIEGTGLFAVGCMVNVGPVTQRQLQFSTGSEPRTLRLIMGAE